MKRLTIGDINAYLDGALNDRRRDEFEQALQADAEAAALVRQYRQHVHELHRLYDDILSEPVPPQMLALLRRPRTT